MNTMTDRFHRRRYGALFLAGSVLLQQTAADVPVLEHVYPAAGHRGTTANVELTGTLKPWPPKVWSDCDGISFEASEKEGVFDVQIAPDAPAGPHLIRLYNEEGASAPRFFIVTEHAEPQDQEPNDRFESPQHIDDLPIAINGKLNKRSDVDCYAIRLEKNDTLTASVDAYVLGSTVDALLRVVDLDGRQQAFNHDAKTLDPELRWTTSRSGIYVVQVMGFQFPAKSDVRFDGGNGFVYRLNLKTNSSAADAPPPAPPDCLVEIEPNNQGPLAQPITIPSTIAGLVGSASDKDCFLVSTAKDQQLELTLESFRHGHVFDPWMRLEDLASKQIAFDDDGGGGRNPKINWTAPAAGSYIIAVGNRMDIGGPGFTYRLTVNEAKVDFQSSIATHSLSVQPGTTNQITATVNRNHGHEGKLTVRIVGLPSGVAVEPVEVSNESEVKLDMIAAHDAKPFSGVVSIMVHDETRRITKNATFSLTSSSVNNGVPGGFTELIIEDTDRIWLTVLPPDPSLEELNL